MGVMGLPMAVNLAQAGYTLTVYDKDPAAAARAAAAIPGVEVARSPAQVARAAAIVVTMLPSGVYVQDVALGDDGLIQGFAEGALLLDTSSSEPWLTVETAGRLAERGVAMVDAPVSGAQPGAQAGELVFMAGGEPAALQRVMPLLEVMGKQVFHLGGIGAGHTMKCLNNMITAMTFMATAEGLAIGTELGLDPDVMTDVLNVSTGMSGSARPTSNSGSPTAPSMTPSSWTSWSRTSASPCAWPATSLSPLHSAARASSCGGRRPAMRQSSRRGRGAASARWSVGWST